MHVTWERRGAAFTREPPPRGARGPGWRCDGPRPPQDARHHAPSHLWWPAWRRGLDVGLGRRTWAGRLGRPIPWDPHEAAAEEIEVCPAKHLALQHFQPVDMALDGTVAPGQRHPRFDRLIVVPEPCGKAAQGLQRTGGGALQPRIEVLGLALAHELREVLRQVDRLGYRGILRVELGELLRLGLRALVFAPQD